MPQFPPKRIFPLSAAHVEERRQALEKYVLELSQEPRVLQNRHFNGFLTAAQHDTYMSGAPIEDVNVHVYLMNGQKITVQATDGMQTQYLLKLVCQHIDLPERLINYFALFIVHKKK